MDDGTTPDSEAPASTPEPEVPPNPPKNPPKGDPAPDPNDDPETRSEDLPPLPVDDDGNLLPETPADYKARKVKEVRLLKVAEQRTLALSYRLAGLTWRQVAERAGYGGPGAAHRAVTEEIQRLPQAKAAELRAMDNLALDQAQTAIWKDVRRGDTFAIGRLIQIMDHRAKLNGLYVPDTEDNTPQAAEALGAFFMQAQAVISDLDAKRAAAEAAEQRELEARTVTVKPADGQATA